MRDLGQRGRGLTHGWSRAHSRVVAGSGPTIRPPENTPGNAFGERSV
jgi:hypothetical protein